MRFIRLYPWIIPLIIFTTLAFLGALAHPLWGDEAETALFGKSILTHGVPYGWDRTNIMGLEDGVVLNQNLINHTSPWPQYYLTALSFLIFGQSTLSARLPFITLAIFSIPLLYYLTLTLTKEKKIALLAVLILSLNVSFILYSFQTRYYSIIMCVGLLFLYSSLSLHEKKLKWKLGFLLSGVLYLYSHYITFPFFYVSCLLSLLAYHILKKTPKKHIRSFILNYVFLGGVIFLTFLPWFIAFNPLERTKDMVTISPWTIFTELSRQYTSGNRFPLVLAPIFLGLAFFKRKVHHRLRISFITILLVVFLYFGIEGTTQIFVKTNSIIAERYNTVVFPLLTIASAIIFYLFLKIHRVLFIVILSVYLFTNLFTVEKPRSFLFEYLHEVLHPYPLPDTIVADYLQKHAKEGDTAFVTLDRDHEPLIFYLNKKIRFVNRISPTNKLVYPENKKQLPSYLYFYLSEPDWVIMYSKRGNDGTFLTFDYRPIYRIEKLKEHYDEIILPVFFSDLSRPEIRLRLFEKVTPRYNDQIFVYKKKKV